MRIIDDACDEATSAATSQCARPAPIHRQYWAWMISAIVGAFVGFAVFYRFYLRDRSTPPEWERLGGAEARALVRELEAGKLDGLRERLGSAREGRWDDRGFWLALLASRVPRPAIERWVSSGEDAALAHLVRGAAHVGWGYEARGGGVASTVTEEGARLFTEHMSRAKDDFEEAARLDPDDPTPWALMLLPCRCLNLDAADARTCFEEATKRDPENYRAHALMLMYLTKKWGGSHDAMFDFARDVAERVDEGSDLGALVIEAHIERWLYFRFDDDREGELQYPRSADVQRECMEAFRRSVGSPRLRSRSSSIRGLNSAAFWFFVENNPAALREALEPIGKAFSDHPWGYWDAPTKKFFRSVRDLAKGG